MREKENALLRNLQRLTPSPVHAGWSLRLVLPQRHCLPRVSFHWSGPYAPANTTVLPRPQRHTARTHARTAQHTTKPAGEFRALRGMYVSDAVWSGPGRSNKLTCQLPVRCFPFLSFVLLSSFFLHIHSQYVVVHPPRHGPSVPITSNKGKQAQTTARETALSAPRFGIPQGLARLRGGGREGGGGPVRLVDHPCPRAPRALRSRGAREGETRAVRPTSDAHGKAGEERLERQAGAPSLPASSPASRPWISHGQNTTHSLPRAPWAQVPRLYRYHTTLRGTPSGSGSPNRHTLLLCSKDSPNTGTTSVVEAFPWVEGGVLPSLLVRWVVAGGPEQAGRGEACKWSL